MLTLHCIVMQYTTIHIVVCWLHIVTAIILYETQDPYASNCVDTVLQGKTKSVSLFLKPAWSAVAN